MIYEQEYQKKSYHVNQKNWREFLENQDIYLKEMFGRSLSFLEKNHVDI